MDSAPEKLYHKRRRKGIRSHFYRYRKSKGTVAPDVSIEVASPVTACSFSTCQTTNTLYSSLSQPSSSNDQPARLPSTSETHLPTDSAPVSTTATLPTALHDTSESNDSNSTATKAFCPDSSSAAIPSDIHLGNQVYNHW